MIYKCVLRDFLMFDVTSCTFAVCLCSTMCVCVVLLLLTDPLVELHANDGVPVPLVVPGAVPELGDPALGHAVGSPGVHQAVGHHQADDGAVVALHRLCEVWVCAWVSS